MFLSDARPGKTVMIARVTQSPIDTLYNDDIVTSVPINSEPSIT